MKGGLVWAERHAALCKHWGSAHQSAIARPLSTSLGRIRLPCESQYEVKERLRLAGEQSARDETLNRHHRAEDSRRGRNRANDRTSRQLRADEGASVPA